MELVKLKMKGSYKTFLIFLAIIILMLSSLGIMYLFYDKLENPSADIEVDGALSINYIAGKGFELTNKETIKFSVTNNENQEHHFNINFLQTRGEGTYKLIDDDTIILTGNLKSTDVIESDYILIEGNITKTYFLELTSNSEEGLKGIIDVRKKDKNITFADIILEDNPTTESTLTKVGDSAATQSEGLIKSNDDIGTSYYFRGKITNNYVSFGNMMWRIVRINGDKTVRLILDGQTEGIANYYLNDATSYDFNQSAMKKFLSNWYEEKLKKYENYIATAKFCSDISHDDAYNYSAYTRVYTNKIPSLNCLGTQVTSNIGLLTIDEVLLAGASPSTFNQSYYLYNSKSENSWYTMTGAKGTANSINMFMVNRNGSISTDINGNLYRGVRPVINLIKNIEMIGEGTIDNPYRLGE